MNIITVTLLFALLLSVFFIVTNRNGYDLVSPAAIACEFSILSVLIMMLFVNKYKIELSLGTVTIIVLALLAFCVGSLVSSRKLSKTTLIKEVEVYNVRVIVFSFIYISVSTILYFFEIRKIATLVGYTSLSDYGMLYFYRTASLAGDSNIASQSKLVGQLVISSFAIAYLLLVDMVKRIIYQKISEDVKTFVLEAITAAVFLVQCILSGGRTQFLYYIESFVFLIVFLYNKKSGKRITQKSAIRLVVVLFLTFVVFYSVGALTGKTAQLNFGNTLFVYIGSPFVALDKLVNNEVVFTTEYFGSNTFIGLVDLLNRIGFSIPAKQMSAPFVTIGNVETNIYGSFARYYADFGLIAMLFIMTLLGFLYQHLYYRLQKDNNHFELRVAIFIVLLRFVFDFAFEERFFLSIVSIGIIVRVFYLVLFYQLFKLKYRFRIK